MKEIPLTKGQVALVDDEDYEALAKRRWHACWMESSQTFYAHHSKLVKDGGGTLSMHRAIVGAQAGQDVDHINGNGLDNRRENLRVCSRAQNLANRRSSRRRRSGLKGAYKLGERWLASIKSNGKTRHLGVFDTPEEAHAAYCAAARELHGEFACFG